MDAMSNPPGPKLVSTTAGAVDSPPPPTAAPYSTSPSDNASPADFSSSPRRPRLHSSYLGAGQSLPHHYSQSHPPRASPTLSSSSSSSPLANSSSVAAAGTTKSHRAEPNTAETHARSASFSVPSHISTSAAAVKNLRSLLPRTRRESMTSDVCIEEDLALADSQLALADDPRQNQNQNQNQQRNQNRQPAASDNSNSNSAVSSEPSSAINNRLSSSSDPTSRRLSGNSIYSLASARGVLTGSSSVHGSELGTPPRSVPGLLSTGKGIVPSQSEPGVSNVTVTTSSTAQQGHSVVGHHHQHHLVPRDLHSQPLDFTKRATRDNMQNSTSNLRSMPDRSRSRAKRRFSGSTATSSHSPSSDRGPHHREREESESSFFPSFFLFALFPLLSYRSSWSCEWVRSLTGCSETISMGSHRCVRP